MELRSNLSVFTQQHKLHNIVKNMEQAGKESRLVEAYQHGKGWPW